jgi:DNA replication protein
VEVMDNSNILNLLQDRPIVVPRLLFNNYKKLNIDEEELIVIMLIISLGNKIEYNPDIFVHELNFDRHKVMKIISSLKEKNILDFEMVKHGRISFEYINLKLLYDKLLNIVIDKKDNDVNVDTSIFNVFEEELGRTLSPMEYEHIKGWVTSLKNDELIKAALKEAVLNGVSSFRYIDTILNEWVKKGYKSKEDILRDKENYRKNKKSVETFDMDWLND